MTSVAPPELRAYQKTALASIWRAYEGGHNRILIQAATGTGKTQMFAGLLKHPQVEAWLRTFPEKQRQMLIVAHREELLDQAAKRIEQLNPGMFVSVEQGDRYANTYGDVVVASVQTLTARKCTRLLRLLKRCRFRIVVIDEAHHAAASSYRNMLVHLGFLPPADLTDKENVEAADFDDVDEMTKALAGWEQTAPKDQLLVGVTATPNRSDTIGLGCVFQTIAFTYGTKPAIEDGWLVPIEPWVIETQTDLGSVRTTAGEFNQKDLAEAVNKEKRNLMAVAAWQERANGLPTLAFTVDVAHAHAVADAFVAAGVKASAISGVTPTEERQRLLRDYTAGKVTLLANAMLLTEGTDLPLTECILHLKPTKSATLYAQMCLDDETQILTDGGWKGIEDALDGVKVAAFDRGDASIHWSDATRVEYPRGGEQMWGIQNPHLDIRVTGGHQMVIRPRRSDGWTLQPAESVPGEFHIPVSGVQEVRHADLTDHDLTFLGLLLTDGNYNRANQQIMLYQSDRYPDVVEMVRRTIAGCSMKATESVVTAPSNFGPRRPLHRWTISRGQPRGTGKHLRGWGYLEEWVSETAKTLTPAYERLSSRQTKVFLNALHAGDGLKRVGSQWVPWTLSVCANPILADQLQSLFVRRGLRCNQAMRTETLAMLHVSESSEWSVVRGEPKDGRPTWGVLPSEESERVWCVTVDTGAIVTRRHGKVAIVGNTGRGLRLHPGKTRCVVIDLVDIARRHSLMAAPVLYGLPPGIKAEGDDLRKIEGELEAFKGQYPEFDLDRALSHGHLTLAQLHAQAKTIDVWAIPELGAEFAKLALQWVQTGSDSFRLQYPYGDDATEILSVQKDLLGKFDISCTLRPHGANPALVRQRTIASGCPTAKAALEIAESYVRNDRREVIRITDKTAPWRRRPASPKQISLLRRRGIPHRPNVTMGEASTLIDMANARRAR